MVSNTRVGRFSTKHRFRPQLEELKGKLPEEVQELLRSTSWEGKGLGSAKSSGGGGGMRRSKSAAVTAHVLTPSRSKGALSDMVRSSPIL
jgi:hypothetical protein